MECNQRICPKAPQPPLHLQSSWRNAWSPALARARVRKARASICAVSIPPLARSLLPQSQQRPPIPLSLAIHPNHHFLYARRSARTPDSPRTSNGTVSAFAIDLANWKTNIAEINKTPGGQGAPAIPRGGRFGPMRSRGELRQRQCGRVSHTSRWFSRRSQRVHACTTVPALDPKRQAVPTRPRKSDLTSPIAGHFALTSASTKFFHLSSGFWKALSLTPNDPAVRFGHSRLWARAISPSVRDGRYVYATDEMANTITGF